MIIPGKDSPQADKIKSSLQFMRLIAMKTPYSEKSFTYPMLVALTWLFDKEAAIFSKEMSFDFKPNNLPGFAPQDFPDSTKMRGTFKTAYAQGQKQVAYALVFPNVSVMKGTGTLALLILKAVGSSYLDDVTRIHRLLSDKYQRHVVTIDMPTTDIRTIRKQMDEGLRAFVDMLDDTQSNIEIPEIDGLSREVLISDWEALTDEILVKAKQFNSTLCNRLLNGIVDVAESLSLNVRIDNEYGDIEKSRMLSDMLKTKLFLDNEHYGYSVVLIVFYRLELQADTYEVTAYEELQEGVSTNTQFVWKYTDGQTIDKIVSDLLSYVKFWHEQNFGTKLGNRKSSRAMKISNLL